ncbi:uncharacterized protein LOC133289552 [Gastrolobium bilobum]|uniref:uncharacterized protein LOC133289552 n=1 Tax=Gastrolobium bilobum TaxID=150636 RepID=UPI002AAF500D|nr:uncharacterized protein LOC133289552 [Gastrolobium bilobum]
MAYRRGRDLFNGDGIDPVDPLNGEDFDDSSSVDSASSCGGGRSSASSTFPGEYGGSRREVGLTERLTDILVDEGDGDLLIQQTNREDRLLQWLQALDMQVMGACRADERLKPLLKMNTACGVTEDPLLTQLTQHFEPSEVGMLVRCFCVPLVSIRVGKINQEGTRLCPTAIRGNLTLVLLPSSDLRLSLIGDDGKTERLFTLTSKSQCSAVVVDEIPSDSSGRSFLVRTPDSRTFYFWCSEKSKLLGIELLAKMKDLLRRKPSIAELSGISKSRLDCFATQLRAFLVGSTGGSSHDNSVCASASANSTACCTFSFENSQSSSSKFPRSRHIGGQTAKGDTTLFQSILSPRSSSFKEVPPRNLSSHRIAAREKIKRRGDSHQPAADSLTNDSTNFLDLSLNSDHDKASEVTKTLAFSPSFLGSLGKLTVPSSLGPGREVPPLVSPLFSPYYCWCPPGISTYPSIAALPQSPGSTVESLHLPPGASLLPNSLSASLLEPVQSLNLSTSMDFPPFLPDPLVRMSLPTSQQIPTFTPLMCDPIVHVPVIDVCSSGQGYFVTAGPAISASIPPLHPKLVKPLISDSDAVVKGARETLRLLISGSSQGNQQLMMDTLPAILTNPDEKNNVFVAGSRGLYRGTRDINVIANSIAAMGLVSLSEVPKGESDLEVCTNCEILEAVKKSNDSVLDDDGGSLDFEQ